ncbi:hypothetical protein [Sphingobacterium sp. DR205]|uniref:hypothetical protein n=1 Tax=Sphingobacterium sp. DR205 TaxID=2713573 RepID=UPI0013E488F9|nr:hypothetical protein [Sphingobacterium sp. DR205]QIH32235.1 hypothetical protein G6053_04660 [Sphingobacterium sp. DR205]
MDNHSFQKLPELLERESSARMASEAARAAGTIAYQDTIFGMQASFKETTEDLNATIGQLNETIGVLLEENRLLRGQKKNSGNSSVSPSKDENRQHRTSSL